MNKKIHHNRSTASRCSCLSVICLSKDKVIILPQDKGLKLKVSNHVYIQHPLIKASYMSDFLNNFNKVIKHTTRKNLTMKVHVCKMYKSPRYR